MYDTCSVKCKWLCACISFRVCEYQMDTVRATKGAQVLVQWDGERGRKNFLNSCFMWWKLYSPSSDYFLNKNVKIVCTSSWTSCISEAFITYLQKGPDLSSTNNEDLLKGVQDLPKCLEAVMGQNCNYIKGMKILTVKEINIFVTEVNCALFL
jgi:hypothetical protein